MIRFNPYLRDKGVQAFPKRIHLKVTMIAQLDFKLAYFEVTVQHFNHYAIGTLQSRYFEKKCHHYFYHFQYIFSSSNLKKEKKKITNLHRMVFHTPQNWSLTNLESKPGHFFLEGEGIYPSAVSLFYVSLTRL